MDLELRNSENGLNGQSLAVAVLVDGENLSASLVEMVLRIANKLGTPFIRRVYGNLPKCKEWDAVPGFRLFHPGPGKNSADLLLSVDAIELSFTGNIDSFVIASSDGDFVHVADRLRERGHTVVGVGLDKTPERFRYACSSFQELPEAGAAIGNAETSQLAAKAPSKMDLLIRTEISKHSKGGAGMLVSALSNVMFKEHGIRISEKPERTWRRYLSKRTALYAIDPSGPALMVRFLKDGFGSDHPS